MPRTPRASKGNIVYHVLNRANARMQLFYSDKDYIAFEVVLSQAHERLPIRILSYCVMPNHFHLVLWPYHDGDLSEFMRWLTVTHTQRWHVAHGTVGLGHIYQGRFKSFPVQSDEHFLIVCRYVERNALRANLVKRAENWRWCSLWRRRFADLQSRALLSDGPIDWPTQWLYLVNQLQAQDDMVDLQKSAARGRPFGDQRWIQKIARRLELVSTLRPRGRPKKCT